jgi:hypothetical protein
VGVADDDGDPDADVDGDDDEKPLAGVMTTLRTKTGPTLPSAV